MSFCPRCRVGQVDETATECPICGYQLPKDKTVAMHVADELEQTTRRELGRHYQIEQLLGRGGMSVVYLARELDLNRNVAVKVLPVRLSFDQESIDRFQREAKIAAALDHPNVVPVYRVGATPSLLWYSMKLVEGQSLGEVLEAHPQMALEECLDIVEQVGAALHYAHRRGVVHRDVKPSNVMLDRDGWAWVCDFGVAKAFGAVPLTQTGSTLGTPRYMSPEQCYAGPLDGRSDQYSFGALVYECLAGKPVFTADSIGEYVHKHTAVTPPSLAEARPDVPAPVVEAVARALHKSPDKRFADVAEFVQALGGRTGRRSLSFRVSTSFPSGPPTPATPTPSFSAVAAPRPRRPARLGLVAIVIVGGAAVATPLLLRRHAVGPTTVDRPSATVAESAGVAPDKRQVAAASVPVAAATGKTTSQPAATRPAPVRPRGAATPTADAAQVNAPSPGAAPPPGVLFVSTTPVLGDLYVDGRRVGTSFTPDGVPVPAGHHEIRVARDGYEPFVRGIDIAAGDTVRLLRLQLKPTRP